MNRRNIFSLSALAALGIVSPAMLATSSGAAHAQAAKDLVGTWQLVTTENTAVDGTKTVSFGPHGEGIAIFESNGHFALININPDVPKFASNNRVQGTPDENKAAVIGGLGYFGTYSVADKVVTFKIEGSTYPNWTGTAQTRTITSFTGDEVKWTLAAGRGGQSESTWKRIK